MGEKIKKCGEIFREAREEKELTINDVAFALDKEQVKLYEKRIRSWEANRDFPELEELYKLSNIIDINPSELLEHREKFRKSFTKTEKEMHTPSHQTDDLSEMMYIITRVIINVFLVIAAFIFVRGVIGLTNAIMGNGDKLTEKVVVREIDREVNSTSNEENTIENNMTNNISNDMANNIVNEVANEIVNN